MTTEPKKYSSQEYRFICEILWGGPPVDRAWAERTRLFKEQAPKILEKYPMLNKSFFEQNKATSE